MTPEAVEALRRDVETPVRASAADLPAVANDLSEAFAADPVFNWFLREDARRGAGRRKLFGLLASIGLTDGEILRPSGGGAASVWLPSERLGPTPFFDELRGLPTILAATGFSRLSRMSAARAAMDKHHPMDRPHAYLWFLGVTPAAQGKGIGGPLLSAGLARVDAVGLPAYLESSNITNIPLYQRQGFVLTGEFQAALGGPTLYPMWREARR